MWRWLALLFLLWLCWHWWQSHTAVEMTPGVAVVEEPEQTRVSGITFDKGDYHVEALAEFELSARVLSREDYHFGRESDLVPVDLALGWGPMSDPAVLEKIEISQGERWYHWQVREFPIPRRAIETHSANMHLIPADDDIESSIKQVHRGDIIHLHGYLASVTAPDGWHWKSSLTRDDTGGGSCELIWVDRFSIR